MYPRQCSSATSAEVVRDGFSICGMTVATEYRTSPGVPPPLWARQASLRPVREAAGAAGAAEFCDRFGTAARALSAA